MATASEQNADRRWQRIKEGPHTLLRLFEFWECSYCRYHYFTKPKRCEKCYHHSFELVKIRMKDARAMIYGNELIIDLHNCKEKIDLQEFCEELCELISVECGTCKGWTADEVLTHVRATSHGHIIYSAKNGSVYLNIFSRKEFDVHFVRMFVEKTFDTTESYLTQVERLCRT